MFGGEGSWTISSTKDPRWNMSGRGHIYFGGMPDSAEKWLMKAEELFGPRPDDLEYSCMKD